MDDAHVGLLNAEHHEGKLPTFPIRGDEIRPDLDGVLELAPLDVIGQLADALLCQ